MRNDCKYLSWIFDRSSIRAQRSWRHYRWRYCDVNLEELASGYSKVNAEAKVCQDIVLKAIEQGSLNRNVTVKDGVVMRSITGDIRRATQNMDLDFIRYPLSSYFSRTLHRKHEYNNIYRSSVTQCIPCTVLVECSRKIICEINAYTLM